MDITEIISSGLLELYVAGLTTGEETQQVTQWAAQYPEVRTEITAIEKAMETVAMANAVQPAAHIKSKLMAAIASVEQKDSATASPVITNTFATAQAPVRNMWKWMAAASIALLLVSSYISFSLYSKNKQNEEQLASKQKELDSNLAVFKQRESAHLLSHHEMDLMLEEGATRIALNKTEKAPGDCSAKIYWNKKTGTVFIDPCHMMAAPAGKTYQLWAMVNGKPVDAGLVKTGTLQDQFSIQKMKVFKDAQAFAITLENEGGSQAPTLENMYVSGTA